ADIGPTVELQASQPQLRLLFDDPVAQLLQRMAQALKLVDEKKDNFDALVVDAEPGFQLLDKPRTRNVRVGEPHPDGSLLWNERSLLPASVLGGPNKSGTPARS